VRRGSYAQKKHFPAELLVMQRVWNEAPHNPQETILPDRI